MKRVLCLSAVLWMVGCASMPTLEELEAEALETGDWSAVEEREALIAKRNARRPAQCPTGHVSYCQKNIGRLDCQCISKAAMNQVFARQ